MSATVNVQDNTFTVGKKLTGTSATAVYTNASGRPAKGIGMRIANTTSSAVTVTIAWYDSQNVSGAGSATAYAMLSGYSLPANQMLDLDLMGMRMSNADELRVTAGTGNALEVTTTVFETRGGTQT